ncbi:MAG: DNA (cytosine-5-)-methyltransferase [Verrucomicrobia bacterium]|nr:MAG: DNA (cytosine-5-)-methyltransferase [Verrucomicrobiota bacterium]
MKSLTCIDLFAGCGGLSLGLEQAGFEPLLFSEISLSAAQTYMLNRRDKNIIPVGDVYSLTNDNLVLLKHHWRMKGIAEVDLVCGGPPCQGYSGIGHRRTFKLDKKEIPSNHLYEEMVRVVRIVQPKMFLFENVKGLLSGRWAADGTKGEIFRDVLNSFKTLTDYHIRWELVCAKDYGVPQNRPRVLMVGIRHDVAFPEHQGKLCDEQATHSGSEAPSAIAEGFLPPPNGRPPSLTELLSDLEDTAYATKSATNTYPHPPLNEVQRQLRTWQGCTAEQYDPLSEHEYSNHAPKIRAKYAHMIANEGEIPEAMQTKKFAQRVFPSHWGSDGPNITATSLPEDYVHYSQPRGPTVREWARIQTFPDWYQFAGPRTTGGRRRAGDPSIGDWSREVPRYTQIGNAVPVQLARKVGEHFAALLRREVRLEYRFGGKIRIAA